MRDDNIYLAACCIGFVVMSIEEEQRFDRLFDSGFCCCCCF